MNIEIKLHTIYLVYTRSAGRSQTSQTTGATTKRQNTTANLPRGKRQRVANLRESESEELEADATLTRANIPKIVEAVLGNLPVGNSDTTDDSGDNLHLGK